MALTLLPGAALLARADIEITDSMQVFKFLREHRTLSTPFATALSCGQARQYDATASHCDIRCTSSYCLSKCDSHDKDRPAPGFKLFTDECTPDQAHVFGENGLIVDIPRTEFDAEGGFWLKPLLQQIGQFVQPTPVSIDLNFVFPRMVKVITDGKVQNVMMIWINGKMIYGPGLQTEDVSIWIAPNLDGLAQILRLSVDREDFMVLHGLVDPMPMP